MKGRTAVVTGASRGSEEPLRQRLASRGANVVINYAGNRQAPRRHRHCARRPRRQAVMMQKA